MLIDATQFSAAGDMCAQIIAACQQLGTSNYPNGATIDARGFTGDQVCSATHATQMLNGCAASGGKLLLGTVHLYADEPTAGATGHYDDGHGSSDGTPAFIIPSKFWGIEGISRGAGDAGATLGTFLSVCTGPGTPISGTNGCHHSFPQRKYGIGSTSVSGTNPTTMTISISPVVTAYVGELAMVKGGVAGENGMFAIQSVTVVGGSTLQIGVVVPPGTPTCSSSGCGNLILGTPILGFGLSTNDPYGTAFNGCGTSHNKLCSAFGEHIKNLGFNCQGTWMNGMTATALDGCIGWQNIYAQEESGADTFIVDNFNFVGVDVHSFAAQNFGPILNAEIYTGSANTNCALGTTGIYLGDAEMRGLDGWTINQSTEQPNPLSPVCGSKPTTAVLLDAQNTEVKNGHCEGFDNCVLIGANNGGASGDEVSGIGGGPSGNAGTNVVQISANNKTTNGNYVVERIRRNNHTNGVMDNINGVTLSDSFVALYAYAGIRAGAVRSGVHANTDLAGFCNVGGTPICTNIGFSQTYSNPPICTCSNATSNAFCHVTVSASTLTVAGGSSGDRLDYICIGQN
jgi:hypothetical protein